MEQIIEFLTPQWRQDASLKHVSQLSQAETWTNITIQLGHEGKWCVAEPSDSQVETILIVAVYQALKGVPAKSETSWFVQFFL
jgi:hypothetical protein